jgi:hypothetical protein
MASDNLLLGIGHRHGAFCLDMSAVHAPWVEVAGIVAEQNIILAIAAEVADLSHMPRRSVGDPGRAGAGDQEGAKVASVITGLRAGGG